MMNVQDSDVQPSDGTGQTFQGMGLGRSGPWYAAGSVGRMLRPGNIGALYVLAILVVVFSILAPSTFPEVATVREVFDNNAITGLAALATIIPLCCGLYDLSVAYTMSLTGVVTAYGITHGLGVGPAILLGMGCAVVVGLVNGSVVVTLRINSFIGTLAVGSLVQAMVSLVSGDTTISGIALTKGYSKIAQSEVGGFTLPVFYLLALCLSVWILLEHTATGRRMYATGFNFEAARLAGVRVRRLQWNSLMASSILGGAAGIVLGSSVSAGTPGIGSPFLLSSFAAAFLGATQLKHGRFNAWGTVLAVIVLGTGVTGLGLASAPQWAGSAYTGVVLLASLAMAGRQRRELGRVAERLRRARIAASAR